jgi:hypothetical protein
VRKRSTTRSTLAVLLLAVFALTVGGAGSVGARPELPEAGMAKKRTVDRPSPGSTGSTAPTPRSSAP